MRPPRNVWPNTESSRGILIFAQFMSEMLNPTTFESFRVYSLDTNARLREALVLVNDVKAGRVPQVSLKPLIEELEWSCSKDAAAKEFAADEIESLTKVVKDKKSFSLDDFEAHIKLLQKLIDGKYKTALENLILSLIYDSQKKIELRKLIGFYCSHILNIGYERKHITDLLDKYFFSHTIQRIGKSTLIRFFREFNGIKRKYLVHAAISTDLSIYLSNLHFHVRHLTSLTNDQADSLRCNINFFETPAALEVTTEQFDPYGAMNYVYQSLSSFRAITYLNPRSMHCKWGETMHVTPARAQSGTRITKGDFLLSNVPTSTVRSVKQLKSMGIYANTINSSFNSNSTERLISSINTAAVARNSVNPENQLISFWSAIEVLLSDPPDGPRISHYEKLLVPCIVLRHARRQIAAVNEGLLIGYRKRFKQLMLQVPPDDSGSRTNAFAYLIYLPEYESLRIELCQLLERNPLALHRVWKLRNDYKDHKSVYRTTLDHYNRVSWQIHRIYRARNQLVHSGIMPTYLESLILNMAEYYRSATAAIIRRAKLEPEPSDIDQVVAEIGIRYSIYKSKFDCNNSRKDLNMTEIQILLGGNT